jgi:hypothetical protein
MQDWLAHTRKLQIEAYGKDPANLEGKDLQFFVIWNSLAAIKELSEATDETRWKPWAVFDEDEPVIDHDPFLKEIVDVQHFIANLLVAAGVTDEEYEAAYHAKMQVNRDRQAKEGGYQSRKGVDKCLNCSRSFDDVREGKTSGLCSLCDPMTNGHR